MSINNKRAILGAQRLDKPNVVSIDKITMLCIALLIYTMGKFQLTDILGIKRVLQFLLITPVFLYCMLRIADIRIGRQLNVLIVFVAIMLVVRVAFNPDVSWIADYVFSILGIFAVSSVTKENIRWIVKCIVIIALFFAVLAMIQLVFLLLFPSFIPILQVAIEDGKLVIMRADTVNEIPANFHPLMLFGLVTTEILDVFGILIPRMRSFTSEPSLLVAFFILPAALGFLLNEHRWSIASSIIVLFCLFSFSGSVQLSIVFSLVYIIFSFFFTTRLIFFSLPLLSAVIILFLFITNGGEAFVAFDAVLGNSSSAGFLSKGNSLVVRGQGLVDGFQEAINSPFGSGFSRVLPLPIVISAMISAGWIGAFLLLFFFYRVINSLDHLIRKRSGTMYDRLSVALFFGAFCAIFTFNDYAMLNFSGLILLYIYYLSISISITERNNVSENL